MTERNNGPKQVYFVRPVGMDGPIKIGCSVDPATRIQVLAAWSPFPLELIGSVPGEFKDEARLHRRFSDLHTRKEWFMSSPLLRHTIEQILSGVLIKDACKAIKPKKPIRNQKRPIHTEDRKLFLTFGQRIRKATRSLFERKNGGMYHEPEDVRLIMHNWRCDKMKNHMPIIPSAEQIARLEEYIANPSGTAVFRKWTHDAPRVLERSAA